MLRRLRCIRFGKSEICLEIFIWKGEEEIHELGSNLQYLTVPLGTRATTLSPKEVPRCYWKTYSAAICEGRYKRSTWCLEDEIDKHILLISLPKRETIENVLKTDQEHKHTPKCYVVYLTPSSKKETKNHRSACHFKSKNEFSRRVNCMYITSSTVQEHKHTRKCYVIAIVPDTIEQNFEKFDDNIPCKIQWGGAGLRLSYKGFRRITR